MVYGFVRQSDGHVDIESAPGEGTVIRLFLPRAERAEQPKPAPKPSGVVPAGRGETVLVVEDDAKVRQVTVSTLVSLGFNVREAENGDDAVAMLEKDSDVALLLSDVKMPGALTGTQLARKVSDDWPSIRVLLTSGYIDDENDVGQFSFIAKPYRVTELAEKVDALLNAPSGGERDGPSLAAAGE